MTINAGYLEYRLSGGSGNTNPNASLGGVMSSHVVGSQTATGISLITGVTINFAAGNNEGAGSLVYNAALKTLSWTAPGGAAGPATPVGADGKYAIFGASDVGMLSVTVVNASLAVADHTDAITIANILNEMFDDVSKTESFNGDVNYRCYYIKNTHSTDQFLAAAVFVGANPTPGSIAIGLDPAGVGNGSTTGVAVTTANEHTAPAGVTFTSPVTEGTGLVTAAIPAGSAVAVWVRRTIAALNTITNPESVALVNTQLYY